MNSLPLSWSIVDLHDRNPKIIKNRKIDWLAIDKLSSSSLLNISEYQKYSQKEILVRGCNFNLKQQLESEGFFSLLVAYEASLDLNENPFSKKSLKDILRRGKRFGKVISVPFSEENKIKLSDFQKIAAHGTKPQLKNLFQMTFEKDHLLYAFIDDNENWLGAVLISQNSEVKLHTELLLRKKDAPVGIMETIIEFIFLESKRKGYKQLSLGEVPFMERIYKNGNLSSKLLYVTGIFLNFSYNHKGLYNFKNKFEPSWNKIFICSSEKVRFKHLFFILIHSNFHKLVLYNLIYSIKKIFYSFFYINDKKLAKST